MAHTISERRRQQRIRELAPKRYLDDNPVALKGTIPRHGER